MSLTFASWNRIAGWLRRLEGLRAVLPMPPVAIRSFPAYDEFKAFVEVYDTRARRRTRWTSRRP